MSNEVTDLLDALHEGTMTIDEVAQRFRDRTWPRRQQPEPASYYEMAADEMRDPDLYVPGSYDDVAAAYHRGDLSDEQYAILINAISESKQADDAQNPGHS
jgi:hypothetical protein